MRFYAIRSGNIFRAVVADNPVAACVAAATFHWRDHKAHPEDVGPPIPGTFFRTAEPGQAEHENVCVHQNLVLKAGEFKAEKVSP